MKNDYISISAFIPSDIYKTKDLTSEEKLIAERLTALCRKEGYAWISNKALANMYGIREDTVSKHIRHLIEYGFIKCKYGKNDNGNKKRTIYLTNNIWDDETIVNSVNNQNDIGYVSKYNNKYNFKKNINYNKTPDGKPMFGKDENDVEYWEGKPIISEPASPEEQAEMEEELSEFRGK